MVLVLKNHQMENLLPMSEEIDAIELAFRELGQGKAMLAPRARLRTPWKEEGGQYYFNNIMGLVPGMKSMALRIDSSFSKEIQVDGSKRRVYPGDFIGLVMLFDMDTCNILAIMDDHYISAMRVGATSAVASNYMARKDAKVMALLGSGEQAKTQVTAHACVRQLTKVKVYSPTAANREKFASESKRRNRHRSRTDQAPPKRRFARSDIVTAATNTVDPGNSRQMDRTRHASQQHRRWRRLLARRERARRRSGNEQRNLIVVGYKQQIFLDKQAEFHDRLERGLVKAEDLHELGDLSTATAAAAKATKRSPFSRTTPAWASSSRSPRRKMYDKAKEKGIGTELPLELFMTQRGDKLFSP